MPPGIETGTRLHIHGLGARGASGCRPGDFFVVVHVAKHPLLHVEDGKVVCRVPVPVYRALAGGTIEVPTLDGTVVIKVPPGARNGQEIRLRAQGMRAPESRRRSDLIIRFEIEMPKKTTRAEKKLLQQLTETAAPAAYPEFGSFQRRLVRLKGENESRHSSSRSAQQSGDGQRRRRT